MTLWPCDLLDESGLRTALEAIQPEVIYHVAGDASLRLRQFDAALAGVTESIDRNIRPSVNLFVAAATARLPALRLLIRIGGLEEYGRGPIPYREDQREEPVSPYSASQTAVTHYLQMLAPRLPFRVLTVRPAVIYGPGQSAQFLIASLIQHCLQNRDFPLGSPNHYREFAYVEDLIDALALMLDRELPSGEIINIGTGKEHLVGDVAALIIRLTGAVIHVLPGSPARAQQVAHLWISVEKAEKLLGWRATIELEEGLKRTIAWFRSQAAT